MHSVAKREVRRGQVGIALTRATRLRQSILKRPFEGRLVPQDPDEEPASVLLERIRRSRQEQAELALADG